MTTADDQLFAALDEILDDLKTPARLRPRSVGPDRAGGPPAPGAGTFSLPERVPWPGRPFPVYEVP